jgi:glutathione S-transferase
MIKLYGMPLSPFARKVLLVLDYKELEYENVPTFPGDEAPEFRAISPLGKVPVLEHDGFNLPDTSAISRYLDRIAPENSIYPDDPQLEATACWLEEFADTKLMENCAGLFRERVVNPKFFNEPTNEKLVQNIVDEGLPQCLAYLESVTPDSGYLVGDTLSIADFAVTTCFLQARYGHFDVEGAVAPKLRNYLDRAFASPLVMQRLEVEKAAVAKIAPGLL